MSAYVKVNGIRNLRKALERGQKDIRKAVSGAIWNTAKAAMKPIKRRVPVAFGELRESVQAYPRGLNGNPVTSVDAPHAGAVEVGSLPHTPNFERLLDWVRLRGIQGQIKGGLRKKFPKSLGPTTPFHARGIGAMLNSFKIGVDIRQSPMTSSAEAALVQVATAIAKGIEKHGTRPHWFVRESLPEIQGILQTEIKKKLAALGSGGYTRIDDVNDSNPGPAMRVKDSELF